MARILVVDDDKKIVRLVRSYLEQANYQVLTAHDGETALHAIRRERPDLVVSDSGAYAVEDEPLPVDERSTTTTGEQGG